MKATKKPVQIDYFPLTEEYIKDIEKLSTHKRPIVIMVNADSEGNEKISYAEVSTEEGVMTCERGNIIIKGIDGEVYPCRKDIFERTYNR